MKMQEEKRESPSDKMHPIIATLSIQNLPENQKKLNQQQTKSKTPPSEHQQGDAKPTKHKVPKKKSPSDIKFMEAMTLEEFASTEKVDKALLSTSGPRALVLHTTAKKEKEYQKDQSNKTDVDFSTDSLDPLVLLDGRPAKQGAALDRQITLFYKMECCICHENGFHFRSLMKHYKERHGVPGYVTCCDKKFHYFYPKKIIEHMAFHLQPNIFM